MNEVTRIINAIEQGDPRATEKLLPLVYGELRVLAAQKMGQEKPGQTLQATALVHEAYIRLIGSEAQDWDSRGHFFKAAAEAMRRILVERARSKGRNKRGGDRLQLSIDDVDAVVNATSDQLFAIDEAIEKGRVDANGELVSQPVESRNVGWFHAKLKKHSRLYYYLERASVRLPFLGGESIGWQVFEPAGWSSAVQNIAPPTTWKVWISSPICVCVRMYRLSTRCRPL